MEMDRLDIGGTIDCKIRDINNMYRYLPYARMSYFLKNILVIWTLVESWRQQQSPEEVDHDWWPPPASARH